ncbi:hypothetical protein BZG73_11585 [Salinivibrio siamensis]|uniref:Uncharacterized protein n=1 Tax=Salinivibrio siamensis TaxID=414286 RepID=A0ABX3K6X9_9GAMM|nr:hypothetical protein [Salinivibrio siamensis]OOE83493.1 hypothetical protein BZG73_11585 [Salinivibrio siamensis]
MSDNKKLSQTKLFKAAIGAPILVSIVLGYVLYTYEDVPKLLADFWTTFRIPMTIASLSIPLVAWVTANHRSEQTIKGLELQKDKRLYEMYYEQQKHFEKVMGRRVKNAKFKYITEEDLPVIFSELYEFNRIKEKGEVTLKSTAVAEMNRFITDTGEILYSFYEHFSERKEKNPDQRRVLNNIIQQMYTLLQNNLHKLSDDIGFKFIGLPDSSVEIFRRAYLEVLHFAYYMGDDFKEVWDVPTEEDGRSRDQNILNVFSAIEEVIRGHMGVDGEANFSNLQNDESLSEVMKVVNATPLQNLVNNSSRKLMENLTNNFEFSDIALIEGKYERYQFPMSEELPAFELWFDEISDNEGDLVLTTPDSEHRARFTILDEKVEVDGKKQTKYTIDDDMGERFEKLSFQSLSSFFCSSPG